MTNIGTNCQLELGYSPEVFQNLFSPGIEPGTFCVLDRCDNRYTTKTACSQWQDGSKWHISSGASRAVLTFVPHMPCADTRRLTAVIV